MYIDLGLVINTFPAATTGAVEVAARATVAIVRAEAAVTGVLCCFLSDL